jgi:hypothetical protein
MAGGIVENHDELNTCDCGTEPVVIWHYIKGVANRIHYFVKCQNCKTRTNDRRRMDNAIEDWNKSIFYGKKKVVQDI